MSGLVLSTGIGRSACARVAAASNGARAMMRIGFHCRRPADRVNACLGAHLRRGPVPYSTPTAGLTGPLVMLADGADAAGHIAVVDNTFLRLPQTLALAFATDSYDPQGEFATHVQTLPFSARFQDVMEPAIEAGAAGFVGIVDGLPWETDQYYVPYDAHQRPIPGVWLSQANGAQVKALLASGPVEAEIVVEADVGPAVSHNVIGTLPGASSEWVIIGSHHDGPWASAVEDVTRGQRYSPMSSCAMPKWWAISWITVRRTSRRSSASSAHRTSWARLKRMTWSRWSSVASVRSGRATPT
jgi:hypothetical protein